MNLVHALVLVLLYNLYFIPLLQTNTIQITSHIKGRKTVLLLS